MHDTYRYNNCLNDVFWCVTRIDASTVSLTCFDIWSASCISCLFDVLVCGTHTYIDSLTDVFSFVIYIDMWTVSLACLCVWCIRINCLTDKFWCVTCVGTSPVSFWSTANICNSCNSNNILFGGIDCCTYVFISSDYFLQVFLSSIYKYIHM